MASATAVAELCGGASPACQRSRTYSAHQGLQASAKGLGAREGAHRARKRMETWRSNSGGEVERRVADGARGGGCCRALRVSWSHG